jgi:homoserine O-acetyltransferase
MLLFSPEFPMLRRRAAPVMWINSADDFINPPELGLAETFAPRIKRGTYVLLPVGKDGKGHGTHTWAVFWQDRLAALLAMSEPRP